MSKILLVENNRKYADCAKTYLTSVGNRVDVAVDYSQAMQKIHKDDINGVITDCFIPEEINSGKIDVGIELITHMKSLDQFEEKINKGLKILGQYINLDSPNIREYARFAVGVSSIKDFPNGPLINAIKQIRSVATKDETTNIMSEGLSKHYNLGRALGIVQEDYYSALMNALDKSESNQPLGLLVSEKSDELGLPLVITTSMTRHDKILRPIQNYASLKKWTLVNCTQDSNKANPEFWKRTFGELEKKLK